MSKILRLNFTKIFDSQAYPPVHGLKMKIREYVRNCLINGTAIELQHLHKHR